jgi:hypothetical protein
MHRDRVGERLEWLSRHLDVTDHQKGQLKPVLAAEFKQMRAVGDDASLTQDQKREKMKEIHEAWRPRVQAILTPEQQQKFARMKEEVQERSGEMNQAHGDSQPRSSGFDLVAAIVVAHLLVNIVHGSCPPELRVTLAPLASIFVIVSVRRFRKVKSGVFGKEEWRELYDCIILQFEDVEYCAYERRGLDLAATKIPVRSPSLSMSSLYRRMPRTYIHPSPWH